MEDFVTWVDSSKIRQHVMNYNDEVGGRLETLFCTNLLQVNRWSHPEMLLQNISVLLQ